jgi:hypothetical protein
MALAPPFVTCEQQAPFGTLEYFPMHCMAYLAAKSGTASECLCSAGHSKVDHCVAAMNVAHTDGPKHPVIAGNGSTQQLMSDNHQTAVAQWNE